jgi:hypothetical protein
MNTYVRGLRPSSKESLGQFIDIELLKLERAFDIPSDIRTIDASEDVLPSDLFVKVDATAGVVTVALPSPTKNRTLHVKKIDASANAVTVASADLIDGAASVNITAQYDSLSFMADGETWSII